MKILIVSALYPPDIATPAPYVKELATRLKSTHEVTLLVYNHIPEAIEGVRIVTIPKNTSLFSRIYAFTKALRALTKETDLIYAHNGPSVEIPLFLSSLLSSKKIVFCLSDERALCHAITETRYKIPLMLALRAADTVVTYADEHNYSAQIKIKNGSRVDLTHPHTRPEIHTLLPYPHDELRAYENSWTLHLQELNRLFSNI